MIGRIARIAASFFAVFGVYWLYALAIVPLIEPRAEALPTTKLTPGELENVRRAPDRNREFLEKHFAKGDWELNSPKVLENDRGKLLVKDYQTLPDKRLKLTPCTMIFFRKGRGGEAGSEGEPIILQAPQGAILEFDEEFDPKRAKIGKLVAGQLQGPITIRSRPSRPGAGDDLLIKTRDVQLLDDRITTSQPVDFQFGPSHGSGREMNIGLAPRAEDEEGGTSVRVGTIQWFELERDVKMHMQLPGPGLLPGDDKARERDSGWAAAPGAPANQKGPEPPVDITCQGPFRFDLGQNVATYSQQVNVLRLNPQGPSDQLTCELLSIYFAPREPAANGSQPSAPPQSGAMPNLEPRLIEATGDPVNVSSPITGSRARCQRLEYDVKTRRIVLEGSDDVELRQGSNEIHTRSLDYQPGVTAGSDRLKALGPGTLQGNSADDPAQKYQARWSKELWVRPEGRNQRVSLIGAAQVRATDRGTLKAEEIHVWLFEVPRPQQPPRGRVQAQPVAFIKPESGGVQVERMMAVGKVEIDSQQLTAATDLLQVWLEDPPDASAGHAATAPPDRPNPSGAGQRSRQAPAQRPQIFNVRGSRVRIRAFRGQKAETSQGPLQVADVTVEGNAQFRETRTPRSDEKPLLAKGDKLHVAQANSPAAKVAVSGKPAYVEARGLSLSGAKIELDRATNRVWVDGSGRMTLPIKQDLSGHALVQSQTLEVTWLGGMKFDGQKAIFDKSVVVRGENETLSTQQLEVTLKRRIDFGDPKLDQTEGGKAMVEEIICRNGFQLDSRSFDERNQTSINHMEAHDLKVNQTTGAIAGSGPGFLTSVRRNTGKNPLALGPAKPAAPAGGAQKKISPFNYLRVQFEGPISGNLLRNEVTFADQVKSVYGPIDDWNQKLEGDDPEELGPESVLLDCDQMTVRSTPGARESLQDAIELEALGNTVAEGQSFTARAHRMTYAKQKDLLVLEGDGRSDAQLFRQTDPTAPTYQAAARKIMYSPSTRTTDVADIGVLDLEQLTGQSSGTPKDGKKSNGLPRGLRKTSSLKSGLATPPR